MKKQIEITNDNTPLFRLVLFLDSCERVSGVSSLVVWPQAQPEGTAGPMLTR